MGEGQDFLSQASNDNIPKSNNQQHKILITLRGLLKMATNSLLFLQMRKKSSTLNLDDLDDFFNQKNEAEVMIWNWWGDKNPCTLCSEAQLPKTAMLERPQV